MSKVVTSLDKSNRWKGCSWLFLSTLKVNTSTTRTFTGLISWESYTIHTHQGFSTKVLEIRFFLEQRNLLRICRHEDTFENLIWVCLFNAFILFCFYSILVFLFFFFFCVFWTLCGPKPSKNRVVSAVQSHGRQSVGTRRAGRGPFKGTPDVS